MNLNSPKKGLRGLFAAFIVTIAISNAAGRVVDPENRTSSNQWIEVFVGALEKLRISVAFGNSGTLSFNSEYDAIVSPLDKYQPGDSDWGKYTADQWQRAFHSGIMSAMIITRPTSKSRVEAYYRRCARHRPRLSEYGCKFVSSWNASEKDRRIFLAFTKSDAEKAFAVKRTLEESGYVVFVFLDEKTSEKWATPSMVGEIFASAGHKIVLDTKSSRGSSGVAFEQKCADLLMATPEEFKPWPFRDLLASNE